MNLLDLPDEILIQIFNQLGIYDFNRLIEAYPKSGSKIEKFYRFYFNQVTPSQKAPIIKLPQYIQVHQLSELDDLFEFKKTSGIDNASLIHFELNGYLDEDPSHFLKIVQNFPNIITLTDQDFFPLSEYHDPENLFKFVNHLLEHLDSTKTKSIRFPRVETLELVDQGLINCDFKKLEFLQTKCLKLFNFHVSASSFKAVSNLELPFLQDLTIIDDAQSINNRKSIIHALKFSKYNNLNFVKLKIYEKEDINGAAVSFFSCDFDGVLFDMKFLKSLNVIVHVPKPRYSVGGLRNFNILHNVQMLSLLDICSIVNMNAPSLKTLALGFSGFAIYLTSENEIKFKNFNAPNLLKLSVDCDAKDHSKKWIICGDQFENINAPILKSVDVDEKSLQSNKTLYFENLEEIYIESYSCWEGKFNRSKLLKLEMILDLNKDIILEDPDPLINTAFSSLQELVFSDSSTHDEFKSRSQNAHDPFDMMKFPFIKTYPTLTSLFIHNTLYNFHELPFDRFLSRFPNLEYLHMGVIKDEFISINGLHMDHLSTLSIILDNDDVQQFEMTNCQFQNLKSLYIAKKYSNYATNEFNAVYGKLENIISPKLEKISTNLSMASLNLENFQCNGIHSVNLDGKVFQIHLGDVSNLTELVIRQPFGKLDYTNVPSSVHRLFLEPPLPAISKNNIEILSYQYNKQNEQEDDDILWP